MRRIVVHAPGGYERLVVEEGADPAPRAGEVLVEVEAAGVSYADCLVRMGVYESARKYVGYPITPGFEIAGTVASVGAGVTGVVPGDAVIGVTRFGGYATRIALPEAQVFRRPSRLDVFQAAAFPAVFLTAFYALFELVHPRPGQTFLVHSAAGGVGGALVQLGKTVGARVVAVVGATHKVEAARALGADAVIDKSTTDLWRAAEHHAPGGYDVVFDANGPSTLRASYEHLASPGKLVVYGFHSMLPKTGGRARLPKLALEWLRTPRFDPLDMTSKNRSVLALNLSYLFEETELLAGAMGALLADVERGAIVLLKVTRVPFAAVADAHRALESGRTVGKLVLEVERARFRVARRDGMIRRP